ncbi:NnrS family protein [Sulfuricystis multivorans]|uniref:NnrS family protein n=1 Tax=Sulfuricystis multivorans TaxID=2211108 RepID=UPI000F818D4C|nr:NnrS family protein [Sulfuricystis multivorans]
MKLLAHPIFALGFRTLFPLACLAGMILPLWWVLVFTGAVPPAPTFGNEAAPGGTSLLPPAPTFGNEAAPGGTSSLPPAPSFVLSPLQWHAHEMFYGYGWALMGGFLLTATKNWVGVRGWHGGALAFLAGAWLLDRFALSIDTAWSPWLFWPSTLLFQLAIVVMLMHTLLKQSLRASGSDNYFFWIALPLFLPAKVLILQGDFYTLGVGMSLALFRLAFLIMLERTQVQFMRHAFRLEILRDARLDLPIKWLAVALIFAELLPASLAGALEFLLAALLCWRFAFWHPARALSRLDIGIMYIGYLMIVAQLVVSGLGRFAEPPWVGTVAVHLFTVGVMGLIGPAMIVRISKGHTGREVVFTRLDKSVLWIMIAGFLARVVAPQFYPPGYFMFLHLAGSCWLVAFGLLLWRTLPMLAAPRVDGKPG